MRYSAIIFLLAFALNALPQNVNKVYVDQWVTNPPPDYGKYPLIYVDFWATWCAPCISSMVHTQMLQKKFGDKVLFLYVSNEPGGKQKEFMQKRGKHFLAAVDYEGVNFDHYNIHSIPQSVLLGPRGKIVWKGQPAELSASALQRLVEKYGGERGNPSRIVLKELPAEDGNEKEKYVSNGQTLYFAKTGNSIANEYYKEPGNFFLSGDLKYILSIVLNTYPALIDMQWVDSYGYTFEMATSNEAGFLAAVYSFLTNHESLSVDTVLKNIPVYHIVDKENSNLFSSEMYDFEKGNNVPLIDETGILLDNATIEEMTRWISAQTGQIFLYEGENTEMYDWNLQLDSTEALIRQLSGELGFDVSLYEDKIPSFSVRPEK